MDMKVTIYNIKGRVGKSPIALELALRNDWAVATNENPDDITISDVLPEERLLVVNENEPFPDLEGYDVVFDLGGKISEHAAPSITAALTQSDLVLIPTVALFDTMVKTNRTVEEIQNYRPELLSRCALVATHLKSKGKFSRKYEDGEQCEMIRAALKEGTGLELPIIPLAETTAFEWARNVQVSVGDLVYGQKADGSPHIEKFIANRFKAIAAQLDTLNDFVLSHE
jgi:hypothetical protein